MSVHLLGGEMLGWSDLDGRHGPGPVRGPAITALLAAGSSRPDLPPGGGRTLVVGPHDPELVDVLDPADLTVLVRGLPDAEALVARYADRPGVQVCCGSPEKLATMPAYDTVIALDGLARLSSVEGPELTWGEAFDLLVSVLRPGGRLLLGVENFLGTHRLLALPGEGTDSDWAALGEYDDTRPAGLTRLRQRLAAAGLWTAGTWAAFPTPLAPAALLSPELLADETVLGFLQATSTGQLFVDRAAGAGRRESPELTDRAAGAGRWESVALTDRAVGAGRWESVALTDRAVGAGRWESVGLAAPVLADPGRVVGAAIRHGTATELAPGWVVLTERVRTADPHTDGPVGGALPADVHGSVGAALHADSYDGGPVGGTLPANPHGSVGAALHADSYSGGLVGGALPAAVLTYAGRLRQVQREPGGGWRFVGGGPVPSGRTVEDLVVAGTLRRDLPAVRALLTAWQAGPQAGVPADQVVVAPDDAWHGLTEAAGPAEALWRLADRFVDAGLAQLWPAGELVATLTAMSGRAPEAPAEHRRRTVSRGWRELLVDRDRLARELAEARARQEWYERTLTERDDELKRLRRIVSLLSGTPTTRAGRVILAGARTARAALRQLRTPD
ncbi:hypothetical protein [Micromonospora zingiberis]|uniref:hypothetical protein n=1 Tax=Micromonospora zingiberis TaxID=2053011 RepID=UPI0013F400C8|nr:hypothetical protein [Micromonospora zingiberis]